MTSHARLFALAPLLFSVACTPIAVTPALRTVPLETAATVRRDHVAVRGSGGIHAAWDEIATAGGGVSVGVTDDAEVQLDGSFGWIDGLSARPLSPYAAAGRVGIKHRPVEWLALTGGLGAGSGPWGAFMGGDLGIIFAYENPYVVPFLALRMQLTAPVDGQTEVFVQQNGDGTTTTTVLRPTVSLWLQPSTGVRIPICTDDACDGVRISLTVAVALTGVVAVDQQHDGSGFGGEGGLQIEL